MKWLDTIKGTLEEFGSRKRQEQLWLSDGSSEVSSFTEAVCGLFDDTGIGIALDRERIVFSPEVDSLFRVLSSKLQAIDSKRSPREIIDDPAFDEIRALANDIRSRIANWSGHHPW